MKQELYLQWYSFKTNERINIGILIKSLGKYYFAYFEEEAKRAQQFGCILPFGTENFGDFMKFNELPEFFKKRILSRERANTAYLKRNNSEEYDEFTLLANSKGESNTDSFLLSRTQEQEKNINK